MVPDSGRAAGVIGLRFRLLAVLPALQEITRSSDMTQTATLDRPAQGVAPHEHKEGTITRTIEQYTSAVPSGTYLGLAIGAIGLSAALKITGNDKGAQFVGHWVPTILILGLYNKLVKQHGSD
jgi:hypothetical protein